METEATFADLEAFRRCPQCTWDPLTDEGARACSWYECPYLPRGMQVRCAYCMFNLFTWEGNPSCEDPSSCPHAAEPLAAAGRVGEWLGRVPAGR